MDVVQPRQIRTLVHQPRFPKIEPYLPPRRGVEFVHPAGGFGVQHPEHRAEARRVVCIRRGMGDEVVMIGKHRPRLDLPSVFFRQRQQAALQHAQTVCAPEVVELLIRRAGDKKRAARCKLMRRRVRPRNLGFRHDGKNAADGIVWEVKFYDCGGGAAEGCRTPGRWRVHRQRPNRAERPGVRQSSGALGRRARVD